MMNVFSHWKIFWNTNFSSAVDLDNDEIDDLLVRIEHENVCSAGDCLVVNTFIIYLVGIRAGIFGPRKSTYLTKLNMV